MIPKNHLDLPQDSLQKADRIKFRLFITAATAGILGVASVPYLRVESSTTDESQLKPKTDSDKRKMPRGFEVAKIELPKIHLESPSQSSSSAVEVISNADNEDEDEVYDEDRLERKQLLYKKGCEINPDEPVCALELEKNNLEEMQFAANCFYDGHTFGGPDFMQFCGQCGGVPVGDLVRFSEDVIRMTDEKRGSVKEAMNKLGHSNVSLEKLRIIHEGCSSNCNENCKEGCGPFDASTIRPARCRANLGEIIKRLEADE